MIDQSDFPLYLKQSAQEIQNELKHVSKEWNNYILNNLPNLEQENKRFTQSFFGGKMLRGTLVRLGYELIKTTPTKAIPKPAAAFEILHTALLIHDDIIDQSPIRRGKPALHVHKDLHYGISQALCLGDLGISLAAKLIAESDFPSNRKVQALAYFLEIINKTILGEMLDVESARSLQRTETQILQIQKMKTANYTIIGPLTLGAILAGAPEEVLKQLKTFGEPLGIAFQIQDDILGIFSDEQTVGKSVTSDMEENKSTLLITYALKHANTQQQTQLKNYYGKKGTTKKEQEMIKKIFLETGSLRYSQDKIKTLTTNAKKVIPQVTKNKSKQQLLTHLADSLIERNK